MNYAGYEINITHSLVDQTKSRKQVEAETWIELWKEPWRPRSKQAENGNSFIID